MKEGRGRKRGWWRARGEREVPRRREEGEEKMLGAGKTEVTPPASGAALGPVPLSEEGSTLTGAQL